MAEEVITKIIEVKQSEASNRTMKDLRQEMSKLRDDLLNLEEGTEEYDKAVKTLQADQEAIAKVMNATKQSTQAAEGSYDALVKKMAELKVVWRATGDEAERAKLGEQIKYINDELKGMDASIGNYQRNVGDYANQVGEALRQWAPTLKESFGGLSKVADGFEMAVIGAEGLNKAMTLFAANPIGAVIMGLVTAFQLFKKAINGAKTEHEEFDKKLDKQDGITKFNVEMMKAKGATEEATLAYQIRVKQMQLDDAKYYLEDAKAKKEGLGWWRFRAKNGLKKDIDSYAESVKRLTEELDDLNNQQKIQKVRDEEDAKKTSADKAKERAKELQEEKKLVDAVNAEIATENMTAEEQERARLESWYAEKLAILQRNGEDTTALNMLYLEKQNDMDLKYFDASVNDTINYTQKRSAEIAKARQEETKSLEVQYAREKALDEQRQREKATLDKLELQRKKQTLTSTGNILDAMSAIVGQDSEAGKAMAVASAIISTYQSAQLAYESAFMPVPTFMSPILGGINMAAAIATGIANVKQILSVNAQGEKGAGALAGAGAVATAPAIIRESPITRTITEGVSTEAMQQMQSTQRVILVYSDVQEADKRVEVQQNESTF